jgi:hypothetical protein
VARSSKARPPTEAALKRVDYKAPRQQISMRALPARPDLAPERALASTIERSANFARHALAHEGIVVPVSASARSAGSSLLRESLALLKALDVGFRSRSDCSSFSKGNLPGQAIPHKLVVCSLARPGTRCSFQRERLTGAITSSRLGIGLCCGHHDRDGDENGRSVHVHSPWG